MANTPFEPNLDNRPFDPIGEVLREDSKTRKETRVADLTVATGKDPEAIAAELETGSKQPIEEAKSSVPTATTEALDTAIQSGIPVDVSRVFITEVAAKQRTAQEDDDYSLEGVSTVGDPRITPATQRYLQNQQIAYEVLTDRFQESTEQGFLGKSVDFADWFLRDMTIGTYEAITRQDEKKGLEIAQAAVSMSPEEFRDYIEQYAEEKSEQGFFSSDNYFAYLDSIFENQNAGYDPDATLNQTLGLVGLVEVGAALRGSLKTTTTLSRAGNLKGPNAATEAAERLLETDLANNPKVQTDLLTKDFDPTENGIKPIASRVAEIASRNKLIQDVQHLHSVGAIAPLANETQIATALAKVQVRIEQTASRAVASQDVVDTTGLGTHTAVFRIGKVKTGDAYRSESSATKQAALFQEKGLSASVVEGEGGGYFVEVAERLKLTRVGEELDYVTQQQNIFSDTIGRVLGSTLQVDDQYLNTLANMGESASVAIQEQFIPYVQTFSKAKFDSKVAINQILRDLRDGPDSYMRRYYTELEFSEKFKAYHPKGKKPSRKDYEAYEAAKTLSDAAFVLEADRIALRYINNGYKTLDLDGSTTPARIVKDVDTSEPIWDASQGKQVWFEDLPEGATIWRTDFDLEGGISYVTKPKQVKEIDPVDVVGYNAGGPRSNPDARYFVTGDGRAFISTFTEKQARTAVDEISNILTAIKTKGANLNRVVLDNNSWNPDIESIDDFTALAERKGWDLKADISFKGRNDVVEGDSRFSGFTEEEAVRISHTRSNDVLMSFGGTESFNYNPMKAITDQMNSASQAYAFKAYTHNSKVSWLKTAGLSKDIELGADINQLWSSVDVDKIKGAKGRFLRKTKEVIERRDSVQDTMSRIFSDFGERIAEWTFDKGAEGLGKGLTGLDVPGALLNLGFRSAFGFFAIPQLILQSSHAIVIGAISPKYGFRAAASVLPIRLAMAAKGKHKAAGLKNLGKFLELSETDMNELETYIRTSGRLIVEADAIQKGTGPGYGYTAFEGQNLKSSVLRKSMAGVADTLDTADKAGLAFFNEGERLSRYTSMITSFMEYKAANKGKSALTPDARIWLTRREQDLSFNMTTTSRGMWQAGVMRIPTQWLSYAMRSLENTVLGRNFTPAERIRMGLTYLTIGGAAGVPFMGNVTDQVASQLGIDPKSPSFTAMQYGWYDGILTWAFQETTEDDVQTAFGSRLAPLSAITDLHSKLFDEGAYTALGGPSGEIVGGAVTALVSGINNLANGSGESSMADLERVLRTPSGVDAMVKAKQILQSGQYTSKSGALMPLEFGRTEALMQAAGITNFRVAEFYREKGTVYRESKELKAFRKEIDVDFDRYLRLAQTDPERANRLVDEIMARIEISGFDDQQKMSLRRSLITDNSKEIHQLILRHARRDNEFGVKRIESLTEARGEL